MTSWGKRMQFGHDRGRPSHACLHGQTDIKIHNGSFISKVLRVYMAATEGHPNVTLSSILGRCLLYTSPSPRDRTRSRMPSSA